MAKWRRKRPPYMESSHQKIIYISSYNLEHDDLSSFLAEQITTFQAEFDGWVSKLTMMASMDEVFNNSAGNKPAIMLIWPDYGTPEIMDSWEQMTGTPTDSFMRGLHEEILDALAEKIVEAVHCYRAPKCIYFDPDSIDKPFFREIDIHKKVSAGEVFKFGTSIMPTDLGSSYDAGRINVELTLEFIIGSKPSYEHSVKREKKQFDHSEWFMYGVLDADARVRWIPPNKGRISNWRGILWAPDADLNQYLLFSPYLPTGDTTVDTRLGDSLTRVQDKTKFPYSINYGLPIALDGFAAGGGDVVYTNHSAWVQHLKRDEPMYLSGEESGGSTSSGFFTMEFDWIGDYKAPTTRVFTFQEGTGSVGEADPKAWVAPEPLWIDGITIDTTVSYDSDEDGLIAIQVMKVDKGMIEEHYTNATTLMKGMDTYNIIDITANVDTMTPLNPAILEFIKIPIEGTNEAGPKVEYIASQDKIPVGKYFDVGDRLEFIPYVEAGDLSDAEIKGDVIVYGHVNYSSKDWGRNVFDGRPVIRQEKLKEMDIFGRGFL